MTTLIKIHRKGQMTLPSRFRTALGVADGSVVELTLKRGKAILTPKLIIDRSHFPTADGEYTPAQRRAIDRGIAQSEKEYQKGRGFGPFDTHAEFIASLHKETKKLKAKKTNRSGR